MTKEQRILLYKIAKLHSDEFYLRMEDHWSPAICRKMDEYSRDIDLAEKEYIETYGALPEWKGMEDVWATMEELERHLDD